MSTCSCPSSSPVPLGAGLSLGTLARVGSDLQAQLGRALASDRQPFDTGPRVAVHDGAPVVSVVGAEGHRVVLVAQSSPGGLRTRLTVTLDLGALVSAASDELHIGVTIDGGSKVEATAVVRIHGAVRVEGRVVSWSHLEIVAIEGRDLTAVLICHLRCLFVELVQVIERVLEFLMVDAQGNWIYLFVRQFEVRVLRLVVCSMSCVLVLAR